MKCMILCCGIGILWIGQWQAVGAETIDKHCRDYPELKVITQEELAAKIEQHCLWLKDAETKVEMERVKDKITNDATSPKLKRWLHDKVASSWEQDSRLNLQDTCVIGKQFTVKSRSSDCVNEADYTNLSLANLSGAILDDSDLSATNLTYANFQGARLWGTKLRRARLWNTNFQRANLGHSKLQLTDMYSVVFVDADLTKADLAGAKLQFSQLAGVVLDETNLRNVEAALNTGWQKAVWDDRPLGFDSVRKRLRDEGFQQEAREMTFAIKHNEYEKNRKGSIGQKIEAVLHLILFYFPSGWGLLPVRPLKMLLSIIGIFGLIYFILLDLKVLSSRLYILWPKHYQSRSSASTKRVEEGHYHRHALDKLPRKPLGSIRLLLIAFYFSVLSAFHIGWRELSLGTWLTQLQRRPYRFEAVGWMRLLSGLQSLICVYLLALSILCYFGAPFDGW